MNTHPQQYPTQFYGRTWMFWAGTMFLPLLVVGWFIMGLSFLFGFDQPPDGADSREMGIVLIVASVLFMPMVFATIFQVYARQTPIFKMYREGIKVRLLWVPIQGSSRLALILLSFVPPLLVLLFVLTLFWRFVTFRLFRVQTFLLQWEDIVEIQTGYNNLTIACWFKNDLDEFEQESTSEIWRFPYEADSFGTSIRKVNESVQFFWDHPDAREFLPSWQDEETLLGNDTFDFR